MKGNVLCNFLEEIESLKEYEIKDGIKNV